MHTTSSEENTKSNVPPPSFKKRDKKFIDFRTLDKKQLALLSKKWEQDVRHVEEKLERLPFNNFSKDDNVKHLWEVANKLWRRVSILERWILKNKK